MKDGGWIKLYRKLRESEIWKEKPFSSGQAWLDMMLRADYNGDTRGTFNESVRELAKAWGWSKSKVHRFLVKLTKNEMISVLFERVGQQPGQQAGQVTILNYDKYQGSWDSNRDSNRTTKPSYPIIYKKKKETNLYRRAKAVLRYLNKKTGRNFRNHNDITARMKDGGTIQDCCHIILTKLQDPFFQKKPHLYSPKTLFRKCHWDTYLNQEPEDFNIGNSTNNKRDGSILYSYDDEESLGG